MLYKPTPKIVVAYIRNLLCFAKIIYSLNRLPTIVQNTINRHAFCCLQNVLVSHETNVYNNIYIVCGNFVDRVSRVHVLEHVSTTFVFVNVGDKEHII